MTKIDHSQAPLRDIVVRAVSLRGGLTLKQLGKTLKAVREAENLDINAFLSGLVEHGDLCRFETNGEPVFAATQKRSATLAGKRLESGILPSSIPKESVPIDESDALLQLLGSPSWQIIDSNCSTLNQFANSTEGEDDSDAKAWRDVARDGAKALSLARIPENPPAQLKRLHLLADSRGIEEPARLDHALRIWAGFVELDDESDPDQDRVVSLPVEARTVVIAGPGAGKTHTVRSRLNRLITEGTPAPSITAVAFSRTAVSELRKRLHDLEDSSELNITTLDSLAGGLVTAANSEITKGDYDRTIQTLTELISTDNMMTREWILEQKHMIFDEAQDIVGDRRKLMLAIISKLPKKCGATVFCDPAQSIYDYSERKNGNTAPEAIDRQLINQFGFEQIHLSRNYRTNNQALLRLAEDGRKFVNDSPDGNTALMQMRELLRESCSEPLPEIQGAKAYPRLHLFRSGGEAAFHASRLADTGLRVRMTGGSDANEPIAFAPFWVSQAMEILHGKGEEAIEDAASAIADDPLAPDAEKLEISLRCALLSNRRYDKDRMIEAMLSGNAPVVPDHPSTVWISTIHASKGREAEDVAFYLPGLEGCEYPDAEAREEARTLFVAATRARNRLYLGAGGAVWQRMKKHNKRYWRRSRRSLQIQVCRHDAIETIPAPGFDPHLNRNPVLRWQRESKLWALHAETMNGDEIHVATFGERFAKDIRKICNGARPGLLFAPIANGTLRIEPLTVASQDALKGVPVLEGFIWLNFLKPRAAK